MKKIYEIENDVDLDNIKITMEEEISRQFRDAIIISRFGYPWGAGVNNGN
jgi:hypothetical protein